MWPLPNPLELFGETVGAAVGWAWDTVTQGVYTWFSSGVLLLMEWVWGVLDAASSPRLTEDWFANGLVAPLAGISVGIVVALMLASAIQAGLGGRPELVVDALKEGPKAIAASAVTLVVMDVLIRGGDVLAEVAWSAGRDDTGQVLDTLAVTMAVAGRLGGTFLGPLALLFGMGGLMVTAVVLFMRSALLYLVAAFAPIVWASSVSPVMRGSARRLVHVAVALVLAKPAITLTLVVGSKLVTNAATGSDAGTDGAAALGTLVTGFACFAVAGFSPWVVYRLLPSVEAAGVSSGIVGGWGRTAMTAAQAGIMVKSLGAATAASAATRALPQTGAAGAGGGGFSGGPQPPGGRAPGGGPAADGPSPRPSAGPTGAAAQAPSPGPAPAPAPAPPAAASPATSAGADGATDPPQATPGAAGATPPPPAPRTAPEWECQPGLAPPCSLDLAPPERRRWRVARSRYDSVPVSMMWALKVTRSMTAATRRASGMTLPHSLKRRFEATATLDFSSRSVRIWNSNSLPRVSSWT